MKLDRCNGVNSPESLHDHRLHPRVFIEIAHVSNERGGDDTSTLIKNETVRWRRCVMLVKFESIRLQPSLGDLMAH